MEQHIPRQKYLDEFYEFIDSVKWTENLINLIEANHPLSCLLNTIKKFNDKKTQLVMIFLELTRGRSNCYLLADILKKDNQKEAAKRLRNYNKSPKFMEYSEKIELDVTMATDLRSGFSKYFKIESIPRGKCVIFINVDELMNEGKRFKYIFEKMYFDVEIIPRMNCPQMSEKLTDLALNETFKGDVMIVMIIGHGYDEKVCGYGEEDGDEMNISDIVNKFSENKCQKSLQSIPKLFFFNCCRKINEIISLPAIASLSGKKIMIDISKIDKTWLNNNTRTFICYACAEGEDAWYDMYQGYTLFGQALSHCIAQYAHDKNLVQILNLTNERLDNENQAPEIRMFKINRELYFNPGLPNNKSANK